MRLILSIAWNIYSQTTLQRSFIIMILDCSNLIFFKITFSCYILLFFNHILPITNNNDIHHDDTYIVNFKYIQIFKRKKMDLSGAH